MPAYRFLAVNESLLNLTTFREIVLALKFPFNLWLSLYPCKLKEIRFEGRGNVRKTLVKFTRSSNCPPQEVLQCISKQCSAFPKHNGSHTGEYLSCTDDTLRASLPYMDKMTSC